MVLPDSGIISPDTAPQVVVPGFDGGTITACVYSTSKVELIPLDLGLLVDTSASMDYQNKWVKVSGALSIVSESSRYNNVGMALQYFPLRLACDEASYAAPAVAMATLPGVGSDLRGSLLSKRMSGGTPLVQSLLGMGRYLSDWAVAHPEHRTVLVVATDGIPDGTCAGSVPENTLEQAVAAATKMAAGVPKVPVFVIGVGDELSSLDQIAVAGGSGKATLISTGADVDKQFIAALDAIRQKSLTCDYPIPPPQGGTLDLGAVNIGFSEAGGRETLLYVSKVDACAAAGDQGWYFNHPTSPTRIVLCPKTCDRISTSTTGEISVVFGCTRVDFIP